MKTVHQTWMMQGQVLPQLSFLILDEPSILRIKKRDLKKEKPMEPSHLKGRTVISVSTDNPVGYVLRVQALDKQLFSSIDVTLKKSGQTFSWLQEAKLMSISRIVEKTAMLINWVSTSTYCPMSRQEDTPGPSPSRHIFCENCR